MNRNKSAEVEYALPVPTPKAGEANGTLFNGLVQGVGIQRDGMLCRGG